jgi:hypothetical protein
MKLKHVLFLAGGYLVVAYAANKFAGISLPANLLGKVLP